MKFEKANEHYARIEKAIQHFEQFNRTLAFDADGHEGRVNELAHAMCMDATDLKLMVKQWCGLEVIHFLELTNTDHGRRSLNSLEPTKSTNPSRRVKVIIQTFNEQQTKDGGQTMRFTFGKSASPFGMIFCARTATGITNLEFQNESLDQAKWLQQIKNQYPKANFTEDNTQIQNTVNHALQISASGLAQTDKLEPITLNVKASPFELHVWQTLMNIEPGQLRSYQHVATRIASPKASRAVGSAIARNPIAMLIPCHRVIKTTGEFGQYRWGAVRKKAIHAWEWALSQHAEYQDLIGI